MRIDVPTHVVVRRSRDSGEMLPLRKSGAWSEIGENPISGERPATAALAAFAALGVSFLARSFLEHLCLAATQFNPRHLWLGAGNRDNTLHPCVLGTNDSRSTRRTCLLVVRHCYATAEKGRPGAKH
jgi:hypothetical protein